MLYLIADLIRIIIIFYLLRQNIKNRELIRDLTKITKKLAERTLK